jgi:sugar O-acyltransferase (sialic acid O-acetyltransferase NeuD family)
MRKLLILGAGGHAKVVAEIARLNQWEVVGFIDGVNPKRKGESFYGSKILGGDEVLEDLFRSDVEHAIVAFGNNRLRVQTAMNLDQMGFQLPTAVHPSAICSGDVDIGDGTVIAAGAVIGPSTSIGRFAIVNTQASLDHECRVCDGAHVGPGALVTGGVVVGKRAWIGAGAVIADHKQIGTDSIVGAGAVVVRDVPESVVVMGVPAIVARSVELA